jgi:uncharacterized protein involved in type VI secretion and phage assembly
MPGDVLPDYVSLRPIVKVNGAAIAEANYNALTLMRVVNGLGVPAYARFEFTVDAQSTGVGVTIGDQLLVQVDGFGNETNWEIFDGIVAGVGIDLQSGIDQILVVEAYDKLFKLGRTSVAKTHVDKSFQDIVKALAGECGLTAEITGSWGQARRPASYQYGTAYEYIDRLVREHGGEWYVKNAKLYVRPRADAGGAAVELEVGRDLVDFSARFSASDHATDVTVTGWDVKQKRPIVAKATAAGGSGVSTIGATTLDKVKSSDVKGNAARSFARPVDDQNAAKQLAEGIVQRREAEAVRARGRVLPNPGVVPGATLRLAGLAGSWDGDYYCTQVEYSWGAESFDTYFEVGSTEPDSLVDILGAGNGSTSLQSLVGGLTVGLVSDQNDPDELHRVKVTLPYLSGEQATGWARVLQLGAGAQRGWNILPEIDDEVLVGFENGDIDRPFVLGGLFNGKDKPKDAKSAIVKNGKIAARVFTSRLGHEVHIADGTSNDEKFIRLKTAGGEATLLLGADKIDLQAEGIPIKVFNKQGFVEIAKNGAITLDSKENITIKSLKDVAIEGMNVNLKAKTGTKVEGVTVDVKAQAKAAIDGGAMTQIKGGMVQIN